LVHPRRGVQWRRPEPQGSGRRPIDQEAALRVGRAHNQLRGLASLRQCLHSVYGRFRFRVRTSSKRRVP